MNAITYQWREFKKHMKTLKKQGKYNSLRIFFDWLFSTIRLGSSVADYFEYEFYNKTYRSRKEFVCYKFKKNFMKSMNDYSKAYIFNNKVEFLNHFQAYTKRDWLDVACSDLETFIAFCKKHPTMIVKPQNSSCGKGIYKLTVVEDYENVYNQLKAETSLIEEIIIQHSHMNTLHSQSLNTIRVATAYINGELEILGAVLRCGSGEGVIDNFCAGGYAAKIDVETGVVISDGCNIEHSRECKHPDTKILFHGFQIPHWDKVLSLIENAAKVVEGVRYIGWDVAIRQDDVVLIEGNFEGMFNVLQEPADKGIKQKTLLLLEKIKN